MEFNGSDILLQQLATSELWKRQSIVSIRL